MTRLMCPALAYLEDERTIVCMGPIGHEHGDEPHYNGTHEWESKGLMQVFDPSAYCIVEGCENDPRRQTCPYDGRDHHHGSIHYDCYRGDKLRFREGWWMWICDKHLAECQDELEARTGKRQTASRYHSR